MHEKFDSLDTSVLVLYFVSVIFTGFLAMFVVQRGTVRGFFLAGRLMTWLPIGASLFASNIGSEHFIGLAGSGAASGIGVAAFELNAAILLQLLGWVFLPVYISSGVSTLPEYMKKRFGGKRIEIYLAFLSLLLYVFTKISVNLYSGSLFLKEALGWDIWPSVLLILGMTSLITLTGGLAAVIYTDTLQFFIMIIGACVLAIMSFAKVGGFPGLLSQYGEAIAPIDALSAQGSNLLISLANISNYNLTSLSELASTPGVDASLRCGLPSPKAFRLLRGIDDPDMPWLGFLLGQTPSSIWYWCADQMMVQRVLSAKSLSHAQGATLMTAAIKQLPLFIMVIPGMICRILFPSEIACIPGDHCFRVCGQRSGCSNLAYPKLVMEIMPSGLRGLMLSVMLAALISDMTSIFNSASTLFAVDIYKQFRKRARESELMLCGRLFVVFLVLVSVGWIPLVQGMQGSQLYLYIQAVSAYLAPPVAAVYLLAVLWPRSNELGAFSALMFGLVLGIVRLILSVIYIDPICGELDTRPVFIARLHYMYFGFSSFACTLLIMIFVSLIGRKPDAMQISRLTYFTAWDLVREMDEHSEHKDTDSTNPRSLGGDGINTVLKSYVTEDTFGKEIWMQPYAIDQAAMNAHASCVTVDTVSADGCVGKCECQSPTGKCLNHLGRWICGCENRPCPPAEETCFLNCICCGRYRGDTNCANVYGENGHDLTNEYAILDKRITSLHQGPTEKRILLVGLVSILSIALFGFIFFSVYFDLVKAGPLHVQTPINVTLPESVINAIGELTNLGIVAKHPSV